MLPADIPVLLAILLATIMLSHNLVTSTVRCYIHLNTSGSKKSYGARLVAFMSFSRGRPYLRLIWQRAKTGCLFMLRPALL